MVAESSQDRLVDCLFRKAKQNLWRVALGDSKADILEFIVSV